MTYHSSEVWQKLIKMKFIYWRVSHKFFYFSKTVGGYRIDVYSDGLTSCGEADINGLPYKKYNKRKAKRFIRKVNKVLENDNDRFNRLTI